MSRGISFQALLGTLFLGIIAALLILIYTMHVRFVEGNSLAQIRSHADSQAESIALLLQPDLISGFYPAVIQRAGRTLRAQPDIVGARVEMRNGYVVFEKVGDKTDAAQILVLKRRVFPSTLAGQSPDESAWIAELTIFFSLAQHNALMKGQRRTIAVFGMGLLFLSAWISMSVSKMLTRPVRRLAEAMTGGDLRSLRDLTPDGGERITEVSDLYARTQFLARQNLEYRDELVQRAKEAALAELARQVAHDIRSPLAALEVVSGDVSNLPEDRRTLIRAAIGRIRDIANSLLDKQRAQTGSEAGSGGAPPECLLLSGLIESLITEKRLQYRSRPGVEIEAWLDAPSYGIFARVQPVEFKRLLSNLINNSVEAFEDGSGSVRVALSARDGEALISVRDNGKGIPLDLLSKLGQRGETYGKSGGSGLGLHHARTSAESWGGSLEIVSAPPRGAMLTVRLPQVQAPDWFVSELVLTAGKAVVILDDDASIHQVWDGRLGGLVDRSIEIVHVATPGELRRWSKDNPGKARGARYLLDFELIGYEDTGLSLAGELGIGTQAILVTSRYEEAEIMERCRTLGARMIPKGLAGVVPIRVDGMTPERVRWDAILIDDDDLSRATWKIAASRLGKRLLSFSTVGEFFSKADAIDRATPVYIDAELGAGVRGDVESLKIHELGFGEIYLATGHEAEKFVELAHLRSVVGKEPPWSRAS